MNPLKPLWVDLPRSRLPRSKPDRIAIAMCPAVGHAVPFALACVAVDRCNRVRLEVRQFLLTEGYARMPKEHRNAYNEGMHTGGLSICNSYDDLQDCAFSVVRDWIARQDAPAVIGGDALSMPWFIDSVETEFGPCFVEVSRGSLTPTLADVRATIAAGNLRLEEHTPLLDWNVANLDVAETDRAVLFRRADGPQGVRHIDGIMSALIAFRLLATTEGAR